MTTRLESMKFLEQIKQLFCFHKWEIYEKREIFPKDYLRELDPDLADYCDKIALPGRQRYKIPIGIKYVLRCEKCGTLHFKIDDYRYYR